MLVHEFRPGRAMIGLAALGVAGAFAGDAADAWQTPWYTVVPVMCGGLGLAALATWIGYRLRRRSLSRASSESTGAPASARDSQPMR
ncbi:hypothetical protein [Streptomyces sp. NPDC050504]|uniref:hypothetical protein n=1 Tax=Streptomyces sp. NPDC050504 TaxID=3365618 RepID=UPI0037B6E0C4